MKLQPVRGSLMIEWLRKYGYLPALFLLARLVLFLALPLEGIVGYGDYWNFYNQASLGWPYLDYWTEFPPIFPTISRLIFLLVGGREHAYQYVLAFTLTAIQAVNVGLFVRLADHFQDPAARLRRAGGYAFLLVGLGYGWWYFDPLAVCMMLLSLVWALDQRDRLAGIALGLGAMIKWFPLVGTGCGMALCAGSAGDINHRARIRYLCAAGGQFMDHLSGDDCGLTAGTRSKGVLGNGLGAARWKSCHRQLPPGGCAHRPQHGWTAQPKQRSSRSLTHLTALCRVGVLALQPGGEEG